MGSKSPTQPGLVHCSAADGDNYLCLISSMVTTMQQTTQSTDIKSVALDRVLDHLATLVRPHAASQTHLRGLGIRFASWKWLILEVTTSASTVLQSLKDEASIKTGKLW